MEAGQWCGAGLRKEDGAAAHTSRGPVMSVPHLAQREDQQQLGWIGGSVFGLRPPSGDTVLSGVPVLPAFNSSSRRQPPDLMQVIRRRLTDVHADPVPTVAGPAGWRATAHSDAGRLRACIDRAAAELAAAMRSHRQRPTALASNSKQEYGCR
jgi:hypothetical protein